MAVYTTTIRHLVDVGFPIFNNYPIFDESYRAVLNQKITDHYYFNEIGLETPAQFAHFLKARMNEIMPYYNQLYVSEKIEFDPMVTMRLIETFTRTNDGTTDIIDETIGSGGGTDSTISTGENHTSTVNDGTIINHATVASDSTTTGGESSTGKTVHSDNPQVVATSANYATSADDTNSDTDSTVTTSSDDVTDNTNTVNSTDTTDGTSGSTVTGTQSNNSTVNGTSKNTTLENENYSRETVGNAGVTSDARLIMDLRLSFLNIDKLIIDELGDLFMNIY